MKPFDLEAAKAGAAVCCRNGLPARIIAFDRIDDHYPITALITSKGGYEGVGCYMLNGGSGDDEEHPYDLLMYEPEPVKHEYWANVYKYGNTLSLSSTLHKTQEDAKIAASPEVLTTVRIEWTE